MNESFNEEMAWRHLQDMQREMENRRLVDGGGPALRWWLPKLARRVWIVAGLATRRPPRWNPALVEPVADSGRARRAADIDAAYVAASRRRRESCSASGPSPAPGTSSSRSQGLARDRTP